jgi:hypothetical protein
LGAGKTARLYGKGEMIFSVDKAIVVEDNKVARRASALATVDASVLVVVVMLVGGLRAGAAVVLVGCGVPRVD